MQYIAQRDEALLRAEQMRIRLRETEAGAQSSRDLELAAAKRRELRQRREAATARADADDARRLAGDAFARRVSSDLLRLAAVASPRQTAIVAESFRIDSRRRTRRMAALDHARAAAESALMAMHDRSAKSGRQSLWLLLFSFIAAAGTVFLLLFPFVPLPQQCAADV
eukprot:Hpha_TRINITY_DN8696_c0_g1::TRINITY_DN8696_c0_g1_i1::g.168731::m.168731